MFRNKQKEILNPIAHVINYVDPRTDQRFTKDLKKAQARQAERDMIADAMIDNAFHGMPYKSIFDEFPGLKEWLNLKDE